MSAIDYQRDWDLYCAGKKIKETRPDFKGWIDVTNSDEWDVTVKNQKLTKENIEYVKAGYQGKEFIDRKPLERPGAKFIGTCKDDDIIIPFGTDKGKPISQVDMKVIVRWSEAEWISKWPTVYNWILQHKEEIDRYKSGYQEGMDELKQLGETLKGNY